jgi:hypothetical protein
MKKYEVTGPKLVRGCAKGETLEHDFTPEQEAALIAAGHIKPSSKSGGGKSKQPKPKAGGGEQDSAEAMSPSASPPDDSKSQGEAAPPPTDKE